MLSVFKVFSQFLCEPANVKSLWSWIVSKLIFFSYKYWISLIIYYFFLSKVKLYDMKIAIIGQSIFASSVYKLLKQDGHKIVGVFTVPDKGKREDPLGNTFFFNDRL